MPEKKEAKKWTERPDLFYGKGQVFQTFVGDPAYHKLVKDELLSDYKEEKDGGVFKEGKKIRVLEIGPGDKPIFKGENVDYLDVSGEVLKDLDGNLIQGDVRNLPFRKGPKYGLIIMNEVLTHVGDEKKLEVIGDLIDRLEGGGHLLLIDRSKDFNESKEAVLKEVKGHPELPEDIKGALSEQITSTVFPPSVDMDGIVSFLRERKDLDGEIVRDEHFSDVPMMFISVDPKALLLWQSGKRVHDLRKALEEGKFTRDLLPKKSISPGRLSEILLKNILNVGMNYRVVLARKRE